MLYKIGTANSLLPVLHHIPPTVYKYAHDILTTLDHEYGAERDINSDDGGYIIYTDSIAELTCQLDIHKLVPEHVNYVDNNKRYINATYILNNEFGVNIFLPTSIVPPNIINRIEE